MSAILPNLNFKMETCIKKLNNKVVMPSLEDDNKTPVLWNMIEFTTA